jgi:hypothetical protein
MVIFRGPWNVKCWFILRPLYILYSFGTFFLALVCCKSIIWQPWLSECKEAVTAGCWRCATEQIEHSYKQIQTEDLCPFFDPRAKKPVYVQVKLKLGLDCFSKVLYPGVPRNEWMCNLNCEKITENVGYFCNSKKNSPKKTFTQKNLDIFI